jgi:hypothetical protein
MTFWSSAVIINSLKRLAPGESAMLRHSSSLASLLLLAAASNALAREPIKVSADHRHLQRGDSTPFFYLGDTAWALFHRLSRVDADRYLQDRATKGFNVIQAVVLSELNGLTDANANGDLPLIDGDPTRPNPKYFEHVDHVIQRAEQLGLTIGLLPSWGHYWRDGERRIFTPASARTYGRFLGTRYRDADLIWTLGGDSNVRTASERAIIDALAAGLREGDGGRHLITFHPRGPGFASEQLRDARWLDFDMNQSSHGATNLDTGLYVAHDRALTPVRPTIDGESRYEGMPVGFYNQGHDPSRRFDDDDVRQAAWWSALAGAAGYTYGDNNIWQMWTPAQKPAIGANVAWSDALDDPGARQSGFLRRFMEAHHFETLAPDQSLILDGPLSGPSKVRAARAADGSRIIVYTPRGDQVTVDLGGIKSAMHTQSWFDPRYGATYTFRTEQSMGIQSFTPPSSGLGKDWVLILESTKS